MAGGKGRRKKGKYEGGIRMPDRSLQTKVALVTGGASGIGRAVAERFVKDGIRVVIADIQTKAGHAAARSLDALFVECDLSRRTDCRALVDRALETLTDREAEVVKLYFGLDREHPLTLEEIGERFSLTRERVRQIKEKAIRRLRHTSRSRELRTYLG